MASEDFDATGGARALRRASASLRDPAASRWPTRLAIGLGVWGVLYVAWSLTSRLPVGTRSFWSDVAFLPVGLVVTLLALEASQARGLDKDSVRAWRFLALAFVLFWLGDAMWFGSQWIWRDETTTSVAYVIGQTAYVAYYAPLLAGLLSFPRFLRSRTEAIQFWLDVATVFLGGLMLVWSVLLEPIVAIEATDVPTVAISILYPIGDLILLFGLSVIAARRRVRGERLVFLLLTLAIVATLLNDSIFSILSVSGGYQSGGTVDAISMIAWLLFGASAEAQRRVGAGVAEEDEAPHAASVSVTPYLAVVVGYLVLFVTALDRRAPSLGAIVVGAILLTAVVLVRQYTAVRENVRLSAEHAARASEKRFRSLVQNSSDMITVVDPSTEIRYQTPSVERLLGYQPQELAGTRFSDLLHPEDQPRALALIAETTERSAAAPVEWRLRRKSGEWFFAEVIVTSLLGDPNIAGIVVTIRDIQERKALERQLTHQAFHDPLTNLANRALLSDRVAHAQARSRRDGRPCAVLLLDLDDFKNINDTHGHGAGDEVLMEVARRVLGCIRAGDTAARLGGDEFALLLEDTPDAAAAREVAERIAAALRTPFLLEGKEAYLSASTGIAISVPGDADIELIRNADVALYLAKEKGKGLCELFEPGMRTAVMQRLELEVDLRRALARSEFLLHYQPIVDLKSAQIVGAEALVRWRHPVRGMLSPAEFIPLAEETGQIVAIGKWVLEEACRSIQELSRGGSPIHVSVNLSARQLQEADIVEQVASALRQSGLPPERLVLEVTESLIMVEPRTMIPRIRALRDLGVRIAIDDFGTGYSSLSYLQNLPVDILKIDRSFIHGPALAPGLSPLARGIVDLGRAMRLVMVAEGIELVEQRDALKTSGCELGQGFFLARPMEAAAFATLLRSTTTLPATSKT